MHGRLRSINIQDLSRPFWRAHTCMKLRKCPHKTIYIYMYDIYMKHATRGDHDDRRILDMYVRGLSTASLSATTAVLQIASLPIYGRVRVLNTHDLSRHCLGQNTEEKSAPQNRRREPRQDGRSRRAQGTRPFWGLSSTFWNGAYGEVVMITRGGVLHVFYFRRHC